MRGAALFIGVIEALLFVAFSFLMLQSTDPIGVAIGRGMVMLMAIPMGVLVVPGLVLAASRRSPRLALGLVLAAVPIAGVLWRMA
ncbi:MAG: hypothetical protein JNM89_10900 [Hyphomicrobiaceae bacterium]|nr:hypothetical protein [Hyphomicrobiaceae bacterium]